MSKILTNYSLKVLNTFGVDVKCKKYSVFSSITELLNLLEFRNSDEKLFILGGGSNVLFSEDFDGLILKNSLIEISERIIDKNKVMLAVGAGENWDEVVEYTVSKNYYGLENLSLIPGLIGAAPIQNIGAYGCELKDVFHSLEAVMIDTGKVRTFSKEACKFGYRDSIFKNELKNKIVITKVNLLLSLEKKINLSYRVLKEYFESHKNLNPTLQEIRKAVIEIRRSKLPDPKTIGNAGSFFKNPTITSIELDQLKSRHSDIPYYDIDDDYFKLSAGWLIEKCGLKGARKGSVGIHKDQALVIVNYGNANGEEIINFAKEIQLKISDEFGILLEPEVNIIN